MTESLNESLGKIAKGTTIILVGTIIGLLLNFATRVLIVRFTTQSEYGIYSLALTITTIFVTISTLGLGDGSTKYIAHFRGKEDYDKINNVIKVSIKIALISGLLTAVILYMLAEFISIDVFHSRDLNQILKIFIISVPFNVLVNVFVAISRGFDRSNIKVYFQDILRPSLNFFFVLFVVYFESSIVGLTYSYVLSMAVTLVLFGKYIRKKIGVSKRKGLKKDSIIRELLLFSIPLVGIQILIMIMNWTDTLMIGYIKNSEEVGIYNAAVPLANLISMIMSSISFMYIPIISQLQSKDLKDEIKKSYVILTKWAFLLTFPIFLILYTQPYFILSTLFGTGYTAAASSLQILSLGIFINDGLGFAHNTLVVTGKSKLLMSTFIISAVLNIMLNIALIPSMGIVGASIATAVSVVVGKIINTVIMYKYIGVHPFTKSYLKTAVISILAVLIVDSLEKFYAGSVLYNSLALLIIGIIYVYILALAKCFDSEDVVLIKEIENRIRLKFFMSN